MAQFPQEQSVEGAFHRQEDTFRDWVVDDSEARYPAESSRYHLYVSWACPWAHRTLLLRRLKKLESVIGISVVDPIRDDEDGWAFRKGSGQTLDTANNGFNYLKEAYLATDPNYNGRITVPILWDTKEKLIVSNSDDDLLRMFNSAFNRFSEVPELDFYPSHLQCEIDLLNKILHKDINDGVYRSGFATTQSAYEEAVLPLFERLDEFEMRLAYQPYLLGDVITESDWRFYVTLVRFDLVYYTHFKCNRKRIIDYPKLSDYLLRLHNIPGVAETLNIDHIQRHYFYTHDDINPNRIVPIGPERIFRDGSLPD